ncbi:unnamed protein product [Paramecium octaurelia]|uniref:Uncharacterized protein n=1 Tax=Paramecium octaurelia TaxID=43137 RepID=A0A8S1SJ10_PAROT|nr:unnamed protein product [Paramecium octaurelia]
MHQVIIVFQLGNQLVKIGLFGKNSIVKPQTYHFQGSKSLSSKHYLEKSSVQILQAPVIVDTLQLSSQSKHFRVVYGVLRHYLQ